MTDLLLQPTGNPSQYEVVAGEQIVGRMHCSARSETVASLGYGRSILPLRMVASERTASKPRAMLPCRQCWFRENKA